MSEFTSAFWDVYIALATVVSIVACGVFLKHQSVHRVPLVDGKPQTSGHVWDEDLREYHNPLPRWWAWLFYLTLAFGLLYVVLYPALGSYRGLLGWTQIGQLEQENERAKAQYGPLYEKFARQDVQALAKDPQALAIGQKLFLNHCAQCHASDAAGSRGFPNLTDRDWLWGGTPEAIRASIAEGRNGVMPPFGPVLGEEGVKDVAHYVLSLSGSAHDSIRAARGREKFAQTCVACHGPEGKGNPQLGAPDLTDRVWLHGSGEAAIVETIAKGRASQMPAHKELLGEAKIHLLTAYVLSLSAAPK
ncbi:MAG: cytochrome-c oxidase, cbb3-type subunit III [Pseudomonadota bacterium]